MSATDPAGGDQHTARGGVEVGPAFLGFVTAIGMVVVLGAVLQALLALLATSGVGFFGVGEAELLVGGAVVGTVVLLPAWTAGGYVATRMARSPGARQGLAVWGWTVLAGLVLAGLAVLTAGGSPLGAVLLPTDAELAVLLAVVLGLPAVVTLLGALLGGVLGTRSHRRVDRARSRDERSVASAP